MTRDLARRGGNAVVWRGAALAGEKLIFLFRLVVLARILLPEDFGLVAIAMAAMVLVATMTDVGVVAALVQDPAVDKHHLDTAWTISVMRGVLVCGLLWLAAPWIASAFGELEARPFVKAIGVTVLFRCAASIRIASLNRDLHFRSLAWIGLATAAVNTAVSIALAPYQGAWALVWGSIAGAATFLLGSFLAAPYMPCLRFSREAAGSIIRFGRWIFLIGIVAVLNDALIRLVITRQLGVAELGLFFMAARLGFLPSQLITEIVGSVAFPIYAQLRGDQNKATIVYRRVLLATAAMMIPACAVFALLVPSLVTEVLGDRWQGSVIVMQLLILSSVIGVVGGGVTPMLKGMGLPRKILWMDLCQLIILVALAWPLVGRFGLFGAGVAWGLSSGVSQLLAARFARAVLERPFAGTGPVLVVILIASIAAMVAAGIVSGSVPGLNGIVAAIGISSVVAITTILFLDGRFGLGLGESLEEPFPWATRQRGLRKKGN